MFGCFTIKPWTFSGQTRNAKVIECYDGDTVTIVMWVGWQRYSFKLRLLGTDAPEIRTRNKQEKIAATVSKEFLENKILGKYVKVVFADNEDKYGRLLGTIFRHGENINELMISNGYAVSYEGGKKKPF